MRRKRLALLQHVGLFRVGRKAYCEKLQATQKRGIDETDWLTWFLVCLGRAAAGAQDMLESAIIKARFWKMFATDVLNDWQSKVINRMLDFFKGKLTSSKLANLAKRSQYTAYRDNVDLLERSILKKSPAGGRSTCYCLVEILLSRVTSDTSAV